jgi:hypothetical protein
MSSGTSRNALAIASWGVFDKVGLREVGLARRNHFLASLGGCCRARHLGAAGVSEALGGGRERHNGTGNAGSERKELFVVGSHTEGSSRSPWLGRSGSAGLIARMRSDWTGGFARQEIAEGNAVSRSVRTSRHPAPSSVIRAGGSGCPRGRRSRARSAAAMTSGRACARQCGRAREIAKGVVEHG